MSWQYIPPGGYPEPQQFYRANMTALSWWEIWRCSGNGCVFFGTLPIMAFLKLFGIRLRTGDRMPREVSFQAVDAATMATCHEAVAPSLEQFAGLGFEHFTTFNVPEMPHQNTIFMLMNRTQDAYAGIYHLNTPVGVRTGIDVVSMFADDSGLTTTDIKDGVALEAPAHHPRQLVVGGTPEQLWKLHQARVAELTLETGGLFGRVSEEHFIETWRRAIREQADFHAARGVYVPVD